MYNYVIAACTSNWIQRMMAVDMARTTATIVSFQYLYTCGTILILIVWMVKMIINTVAWLEKKVDKILTWIVGVYSSRLAGVYRLASTVSSTEMNQYATRSEKSQAAVLSFAVETPRNTVTHQHLPTYTWKPQTAGGDGELRFHCQPYLTYHSGIRCAIFVLYTTTHQLLSTLFS